MEHIFKVTAETHKTVADFKKLYPDNVIIAIGTINEIITRLADYDNMCVCDAWERVNNYDAPVIILEV